MLVPRLYACYRASVYQVDMAALYTGPAVIVTFDAMQARVSELLRRSKADGLSREEEVELDRYRYLEHLVRLAKARALEQISPGG